LCLVFGIEVSRVLTDADVHVNLLLMADRMLLYRQRCWSVSVLKVVWSL